MRIFKGSNIDNNWVCPICKENTDKEVTLVGIDGTQDGYNIQAEQVHIDCLELIYYKDKNIIAMVIE